MNKLILFDVDGTLSKSRRTIEDEMVNCLKELKKHDNITLGIVGGSNLEKQIGNQGPDHQKPINNLSKIEAWRGSGRILALGPVSGGVWDDFYAILESR